MTTPTPHLDVGTFRVGDKPAKEVLACFELGHRLSAVEHLAPDGYPDYVEYGCAICAIRYKVLVNDDRRKA